MAESRIRREALLGFHTVIADRRLRTLVGTLTATTFVEGMIDTLIVVVALDQLALSDASVGYLNALWGLGGIVGGVVALGLLGRGRLAAGLTFGSLMIGLPLIALAAFTSVAVALAVMLAVGVGYSLVETAGLTLMQRLASDEVLGRVFGVVESTYVASTGIGAATAPALISLVGVRGALAVVGAALPLLAVVRWRTLARYEAGSPIPERQFELLRGVPLFAPLPVASVENLALRLSPVSVAAGQEVIRQGDVGDRFYVIADGEVEVLVDSGHVRIERGGEFFGEIALLNGSRRTATVRASDARTALRTGERGVHRVGHREPALRPGGRRRDRRTARPPAGVLTRRRRRAPLARSASRAARARFGG